MGGGADGPEDSIVARKYGKIQRAYAIDTLLPCRFKLPVMKADGAADRDGSCRLGWAMGKVV